MLSALSGSTVFLDDEAVSDENVPDDGFFTVFKVAIFSQFFQDAVELLYSFALLLLPREEHKSTKCDVSWADKGNLHHFPEFEGSQIVNIVVREFLC